VCISKLDEFESIHKGTYVYLNVCYEFYNAFSSRDMSLEGRIESLAYVVFFFRLWNLWLNDMQKKKKFSRDRNGVSNQAYCDLELCVGAFCTIVGIISDFPEFQHLGNAIFDPERMVSIWW